jgi:putative tricarboxylic transport membrane protein
MERAPRPLRPGELAFGYFLLGLSLFLFRYAYAIEGFASPSSAGTFPLAATALMAATALVAIVRGHRAARAHAPEGSARAFLAEVTPLGVIAFAGMIVAYALALDMAGFLLATFVFLTAAIAAFHRRGLLLAAVVSLAALAAVYVVFRVIFVVVLPQGWLFR